MEAYLAPLEAIPVQVDASWTGENFLNSNSEQWGTYVYLVVLGALASFAMAWSIGANDVANAFATSVGAKTITLWQAVIIAAIFEFVGAVVLGGEVARTIAGSITSPTYFQSVPELFAFGMLCALTSAATIVTVATYWSAAVSTTHSIIGAVLGFGLVFGGAESIVWNRTIDQFPYRQGVVTVFMSWFIAPTMSAILAGLIYFLNRTIILRRKNSTEWAFWSLPVLAFITVFINIFFVLYKGAGKDLSGQVGALYWDKAGTTAAWVSAVAGVGAGLLCIPAVFWLKKKLAAKLAQGDVAADAPAGTKDVKDVEGTAGSGSEEVAAESGNVFQRALTGVKKQLTKSLTMDIHEGLEKDARVAQLHADAEVFDPHTEDVYKYLQVFSACCVSFAHGANDVANAIGPFAGIWYVYNNHNVSSSGETPIWILAMGGAGLVVGLATYGYNIIRVLGVQMAKMTPSRGFSAELGTSLVIALASVYGLPVSTTQTIVGAEIGVGLVDGGIKGTGVNWGLFARTFLGWVLAFTGAAFFSATIFSLGAFAPSINNLDVTNNYNTAMASAMRAQLGVMNSTNLARATPDDVLGEQLTGLSTNLTNMMNLKSNGAVNQYNMMFLLQNVTGLYLQETIPSYNATA